MATTPRIADIGAVPDGLGEDLTRFLQQVQRLLRTGVQTGGISGSGSGSSSSGGTTIIGGGGTGGGSVPGMDDPTPPPTPSGVTVSAGLSYVFFETAAPVFTMGAGYDRTRVYIAQYPTSAPTPPTFGDAVLAYEFVGQIGAMPAEPATRLCVWLKWRTRAGYDSTTPAGGINGFIVETGQDVSKLLAALTGEITSSQLHAALGTRIDLIDGPDTMPGSVAARILSEAETRETADEAIASSVTTLQSRVDTGDVAPFDPLQSWEFEGTSDGWTASGATLTTSDQSVRLSATSADPTLASPAIGVAGSVNNKVRMRVRRVAGSAWQGTLYYSTAGHGYSESFKRDVPQPASWSGWHILEWDMEALTAGGSDWTSSTITSLRFDLGNSPSDVFDIDWISVGKRSVGIARATVDAAIQVEAETRATVDGHVASLYTVRTSLTSGGRTVVGGFGLSGTSTPTSGPTIDFGVRADRFWIGPPDDGSAPGVGDILPFIVQATPTTINGLAVPAGVYINDAFIRNGTITNAKIGNAAIDDAKIANLSAAKITAGSLAVGQYIQSSNYIAGTQGWRINADGSAQFTAASIQGQLTAGQIDTRGLDIKDSSGAIVFRSGGGPAVIDGQRQVDQPPQYFSPGEIFHFKESSFIGVSGAGTYGTLRTNRSYGTGSDLSGGSVNQWYESEGKVWARKSASATTWGSWEAVPNGTITTANVSTFIASAAIGTAQIADLAVGDAKIGNFIKSFNFNGAIDSSGNITNVGTAGWALGRAGVMVVDAAHVRGRLTASQLNVSELTAITANLGNVTAGTLSNSGGTTHINLNATGSQFLLRAGAFDFPSGKYPIQITADGDAMFTKRVASGTWNGNVVFKEFSANGIDGATILIDTGYNITLGVLSDREFVSRWSSIMTFGTGDTAASPGDFVRALQMKMGVRRVTTTYRSGAFSNQATNPFGPNNDRVFIEAFIRYNSGLASAEFGDVRITQLGWILYLGT